MSDTAAPNGLTPDLQALVAQLQTAGADPVSVIRQWHASRRPAGLTAALRRAALTRRFNAPLFSELCSDLGESVSFDEFVRLPEVRPLPRGAGYTIVEDARAALVEDWRKNPADWAHWNTRLADFVKAHEPRDVVSRLYYLVRSQPDQARAFFEEEFAKAEQRFDLSRCFALLEVLTQAQKELGTALALSREAHQQRYNALALFAGDYYRTRTYQHRPGALEAVQQVLESDDRWILHLHATGGMGKTMFLRWFVTDQLLARRVACARVDFDDVNTANVTRYPWLLLLPFAEQLNAQLAKKFFSEIIDQLAPFAPFLWLPQTRSAVSDAVESPQQVTVTPEHEPGAQHTKKFGSILREAGTPAVLILDTLEGVTLSAEFAPIFGLLSELHELAPHMRAVLAGRYNIADKLAAVTRETQPPAAAPAAAPVGPIVPTTQSLIDPLAAFKASTLDFELTRFLDDEARTYLQERGISDEAVVEAIVAKVREPAEGTTPAGSNPFTLSLFADLVLGRDAITVDEVRDLPSAHFVYLVERVIKRIPEQPLRWVVRYGALPRRLTPEFIEVVLREPLEQALKGTHEHDVPRVHTRGNSQIREPDLWNPEPQARTDTLWDDLCRYEAPRGWIWRAPGTEHAVQFHGDVVDPMRDLLSSQPIFPVLQQRAIDYFEQLARNDSQRWADWTCEAIFHRFQLDCDQAASYWADQLRVARTKGNPAWTRQIAREVLRREYADEEVTPRERGEPPTALISSATLGRAHLESARAILAENGVVTVSSVDWQEFKRHVTAARQLLPPDTVVTTSAVTVHFDAAELVVAGDFATAEQMLSAALQTACAEDLFGLHLHVARTQAVFRRPSTPEHYRAAIASHPGPGATRLSAVDLELELAQWHVSEGDVVLAADPFTRALDLAGDDVKAAAKVRLLTAWAALRVWDFERATALADDTRPHEPTSARLQRFDAWLALAVGDPQRAMSLASNALSAASGIEEEARARDLVAKAEAERMNFSRAFEEWERAIGLFAKAPAVNAIESCSLDRIVVEGRVTGNYSAAAASLTQIQHLPGMRDAEVAARALVEKLFVEVKSSDRNAALETYKALRSERQPPWPAVLRARVLCHGIALGLVDFNDETYEELMTVLDQVRPASARLTLADAFRCSAGIATSPRRRESLLALFPVPSPQSIGFGVKALHVGEIHRALGSLDTARELLASALASMLSRDDLWGALQAWQGLRRLDRSIAIPAEAAALLNASGTGGLSFAQAAFIVELLARQIEVGELRDAERLLEQTRHVIEQMPVVTRWHAQHAELRAALAAAMHQNDDAGVQAGSRILVSAMSHIARDRYISLGDPEGIIRVTERFLSQKAAAPVEPLQSRTRRHKVGLADPRQLQEALERGGYDSIVERLLAGADRPWFAELLDKGIDPGLRAQRDAEFRLDLPVGPASALPWEWLFLPGRVHRLRQTTIRFAREMVLWIQDSLNAVGRRVFVDGHFGPGTEHALSSFAQSKGLDPSDATAPEVLEALRADAFRAATRTRPILIVKPHTAYEEAESVSLESRAGVTIEQFYSGASQYPVQLFESPEPHQLMRGIEGTNPAVIHIVCALTEINGLPVMTFDRGGRPDSRSIVSARSLCDAVRSRQHAGPFVVLDVARPSSEWETARALLLRNHFASELFASDGVTGVLATGLAQPWDVGHLAQVIAREVSEGASQRGLAKAVQELAVSADFSVRAAFAGTALFSSEPELPCLMV